jgi:hypothetical protein
VRAAKQVETELAAQKRQRGNDEILAHSQSGEQLVDLVALGQAKLAYVGAIHPGNVAAIENDRPRSGSDFAGEHLEEPRLAGTVGADDPAQHSAVELINRMTKLISRVSDPDDARRVLLKLTRKGEQKLQALSRVNLEELRRAASPAMSRLLRSFRSGAR